MELKSFVFLEMLINCDFIVAIKTYEQENNIEE